MIARCYNPKATGYANYGGRGIVVCDRWRKDFAVFLGDMGSRPSRQHTLDRKDNDGDYTPENCEWRGRKAQARNRRNSRLIDFDGATRTVTEWGERTGIRASIIFARLRRGWDTNRALTEPEASHR